MDFKDVKLRKEGHIKMSHTCDFIDVKLSEAAPDRLPSSAPGLRHGPAALCAEGVGREGAPPNPEAPGSDITITSNCSQNAQQETSFVRCDN